MLCRFRSILFPSVLLCAAVFAIPLPPAFGQEGQEADHEALRRLKANFEQAVNENQLEMLKPHLGRRQSRFERALDRVRKFIRMRRLDLVEEMSGGMPIWTQPPAPPYVMDRGRRRR